MGVTSTLQGLICLAQGHNAVSPVRLEPTTPGSRDKHFSTEQLRSFFMLQQLDFQILSSGAMRSAMARLVERKSC